MLDKNAILVSISDLKEIGIPVPKPVWIYVAIKNVISTNLVAEPERNILDRCLKY